MTREEFCTALVAVKEKANVRLAECLPIIAQLTLKKIEKIESAEFDFNMSDALLYLEMSKGSMELSHYDYYWVETLQDLSDALKSDRKESELTITDLARRSHVSSKIIAAFEDGRCNLKVDTFLKIADALQLDIKIE